MVLVDPRLLLHPSSWRLYPIAETCLFGLASTAVGVAAALVGHQGEAGLRLARAWSVALPAPSRQGLISREHVDNIVGFC